MVSDHEFLRTRARLAELATAVYSLDVLGYLNRLVETEGLGALFVEQAGGDREQLLALARAALSFQNEVRRLAVEEGKRA